MARSDYKAIETIEEANLNPGGDELDTHTKNESNVVHDRSELPEPSPVEQSVTDKLTNIIKNYYNSPIGVYPLTEYFYQVTEEHLIIYDRFCAKLIEVGVGSFTLEEIRWIEANLPLYDTKDVSSGEYTYLDFREMRKDGWMVFRRSGSDAYLIGYIRKFLNNHKPLSITMPEYYFEDRQDNIIISPYERIEIENFISDTKPAIDVTDIVVSSTNIRLLQDETQPLQITVYPILATNKELEISIENPDIVSYQDGIVKALKEGTTYINIRSVQNPEIYVVIDVAVFEYEQLYNDEFFIIREDPTYLYPRSYIKDVRENISIEDFFNTFKNNNQSLHMFNQVGDEIDALFNLVTTGMTIKLIANGEELESIDVVVLGDCSEDGLITDTDINIIRDYINGVRTLEGLDYIAADFNHDGTVNLYDVSAIQEYIDNRF